MSEAAQDTHEKRYVGIDPPKVEHHIEPSRWTRKRLSEIEDGDHLRIDEQDMGDIHEPPERHEREELDAD